jgi:DASH complex subunit DAD3
MDPTTNTLLSSPELSPLEQEVLEEYERLAENMKKVNMSNKMSLS